MVQMMEIHRVPILFPDAFIDFLEEMFLHFWYVFRTTEIILVFKNYPFSIIVSL